MNEEDIEEWRTYWHAYIDVTAETLKRLVRVVEKCPDEVRDETTDVRAVR